MNKAKALLVGLILSSTVLTGCTSLNELTGKSSNQMVITAPTQMALLMTRCSTEQPKRSIIPNGDFECKNGVCSGKFTAFAEDVFGCARRFK